MTVAEQREAIYIAEREIETALDKLRKTARINADEIKIQALLDDNMDEIPVIKVNVILSKITPSALTPGKKG